MGADEESTHERLKARLGELVNTEIAEHRAGSSKTRAMRFSAEFASVIDPLRCATALEAGMAERNATVPADKRIEFRIGGH